MSKVSKLAAAGLVGLGLMAAASAPAMAQRGGDGVGTGCATAATPSSTTPGTGDGNYNQTPGAGSCTTVRPDPKKSGCYIVERGKYQFGPRNGRLHVFTKDQNRIFKVVGQFCNDKFAQTAQSRGFTPSGEGDGAYKAHYTFAQLNDGKEQNIYAVNGFNDPRYQQTDAKMDALAASLIGGKTAKPTKAQTCQESGGVLRGVKVKRGGKTRFVSRCVQAFQKAAAVVTTKATKAFSATPAAATAPRAIEAAPSTINICKSKALQAEINAAGGCKTFNVVAMKRKGNSATVTVKTASGKLATVGVRHSEACAEKARRRALLVR